MGRARPVIASLIIALSLTSCSSNKTAKISENSQPMTTAKIASCTPEIFKGGSDWIKGQLYAFSKGTLEEAYSFASPAFRQSNSIELFTFLIVGQYSMLLTARKYQIDSCEKSGGRYLFQGTLLDSQGNEYNLRYLLSLVDEKWGVEGADVVKKLDRIDY